MVSDVRIAQADLQGVLFETRPQYRVGTNAHNRNAYGNAAQEIVCSALGLNRIRINGNYDICFDGEKDGMFYEIKSVRWGQKIVVYDWRLRKEATAGVPVCYAILSRQGDVQAKTGDDLLYLLASRQNVRLELLLVGVEVLTEIRSSYPLYKIKRTYLDPRNGYTREGYREGYRNIPYFDIRCRTVEYGKISFLLYEMCFTIALRRNLSLNFDSLTSTTV